MSSEVGLWPALERLWVVHVGAYPKALSVSHDGSLVAVGTAAGELVLLEARSGATLVSSLAHPGGVHAACWAPHDPVLASAGQDGAACLRRSDGSVLAALPALPSSVEQAAWAPDGSSVAFASSREARVFSPSGQPELDFDLRGRSIGALGFGPSRGAPLAIAHEGGVTLIARRGALSNRVLTCPGKPLSLAFSPDGAILACATEDRVVRLFWFGTSRSSEISTFSSVPRALSWSYAGGLLAIGGDPRVSLWSFTDSGSQGSEPVRLVGHRALCTALAFHPNGRTLASGGDDMRVLLWNAGESATPRELGALEDTIVRLCWSRSGRLLLAADATGSVSAWCEA